MADGVFQVSVLTPEENLLEAGARAVVLRSSDGELTILDGHTAIVVDVVAGGVRVDRDEGEPVRLAVHGGYLQVETGAGLDGSDARSTRVTLLAGVAELADRIDVGRAERARAAAEARVEELRAATGRAGTTAGGGAAPAGGGGAGAEPAATPEDLELAEAEAALRRAEVRLEVTGTTA